jgi:hypothetical protein
MNQPLPSASPKPAPATSPDIAYSCLALLSELEASFEASQQALMKRDLARLNELTREQSALRRKFSVFSAQDRSSTKTSLRDYPLAPGLRSAAVRVLHLGRVQLALLDRAQRSMRAFSRLLVGPQASYGPLANVEGIAVRRNLNLSSGEE